MIGAKTITVRLIVWNLIRSMCVSSAHLNFLTITFVSLLYRIFLKTANEMMLSQRCIMNGDAMVWMEIMEACDTKANKENYSSTDVQCHNFKCQDLNCFQCFAKKKKMTTDCVKMNFKHKCTGTPFPLQQTHPHKKWIHKSVFFQYLKIINKLS